MKEHIKQHLLERCKRGAPCIPFDSAALNVSDIAELVQILNEHKANFDKTLQIRLSQNGLGNNAFDSLLTLDLPYGFTLDLSRNNIELAALEHLAAADPKSSSLLSVDLSDNAFSQYTLNGKTYTNVGLTKAVSLIKSSRIPISVESDNLFKPHLPEIKAAQAEMKKQLTEEAVQTDANSEGSDSTALTTPMTFFAQEPAKPTKQQSAPGQSPTNHSDSD
jgi:hypothetical protein